MRIPHPRIAPRRWLRLPRRTARLRLTALYGGLFLLSGVALVAVTFALFQRTTEFTTPHLPVVPNTPAIQALPLPSQLFAAIPRLAFDQHQLAQAVQQLPTASGLPSGVTPIPSPASGPSGQSSPAPDLIPGQLSQIQQQVTQDSQQLAQVSQQLAQAVHQVAKAGSLEAAQRAADSHQLLVDSGIALAIAALIAVALGWLVAGRVLRPVRTITAAARRISATNLHERLGLDHADDEFKQLGDTLDDLFARLEAAFAAQRHFVANASHELRTPITRERALVQVTLGDPSTSEVWRSTGKELLASNREQEAIIEALLTLASSEGGLDHREPVDLAEITAAVLLDRGDADRLGLHIEATTAAAPVDGDPRLLESLVANLVDNALTHNVEGGHVQVSTASAGGRALVVVGNTGPVVPPGDIDRLFQPFQRLDPRRIHRNKGHGLGLSIVRAIATAHGAAITAEPSPGGGVRIEVAFPPPAHPQGTGHETTAEPLSTTTATGARPGAGAEPAAAALPEAEA